MSARAWASAIISIIVMVILTLVIYNVVAMYTEPNTEQQPQVTVPVDLSWQSAFLAGYEAQLGEVEQDQADMLVANARMTCLYLADHTLPQTWEYGVDKLGMSSDQTAVVIDVAIPTLCPEHSNLLEGGM